MSMTASDVQQYQETYRAAASEYLGVEVQAAGILQRPGVVAGMVGAKAGGSFGGLLGRSLGRRLAKVGSPDAPEGLPTQVLVACTDHDVHALAFERKGSGVRITSRVRTWPRAAMGAGTRTPGRLADQLAIPLSDGTSINLDSPHMPGAAIDFNQPLLEALGVW